MKLSVIQVSSDGLKETKVREWVERFVFGGLVSAIAGLVSLKAGPVVGGLFLAFPSILPATVTLVKKYKGRAEAAEDARGAAIGSIGLVSFALIVFLTAESWSPVSSLAAATLGWVFTSLIVWLVVE